MKMAFMLLVQEGWGLKQLVDCFTHDTTEEVGDQDGVLVVAINAQTYI
jgi:hypothetical protein